MASGFVEACWLWLYLEMLCSGLCPVGEMRHQVD